MTTLPTGSKVISNIYYQAPDGKMYMFLGAQFAPNAYSEVTDKATIEGLIGAKEPANANIQSHIASTSNPHSVTKSQVGLGSVDNTSDVNKPVSVAQVAINVANNSAIAGKEPANANIQSHIASVANPHVVTKSQVGLANADNTSDLSKPISTAMQAALTTNTNAIALKADISQVTNAQSQGAWNASTNIPTLSTTPLTVGKFYEVSVAGTSSIPTGGSIAYLPGDKLISNGTVWQHIPFAGAKIATWTALGFPQGSQVNYLGKDWVSNAATLSTDIPGASSKWVDRLPGYKADIYPIITISNPVKDAEFLKQTVGSVPGAPWIFTSGGASTFLAPSRVIGAQNPIGNTALEIDCSKRSSDSKTTDYQIYQTVIIPKKHRGSAIWSACFWMKREGLEAVIRQGAVYYLSDEAATVAISNTILPVPVILNETVGGYALVQFKNIPLPAAAKSVVVFTRIQWDAAILTPLDTIRKMTITGLTTVFNGTIAEGFIKNTDEIISDAIIAAAPAVATPLVYSDFEELNNNPVKDSQFLKQIIGASAVSPWSIGTGGASRYLGVSRVVTILSPFSNAALEIDGYKRSSDGFATDNQVYNSAIIPKHLQGKALWSFGGWVKRETLGVGLLNGVCYYRSDEAGTVQISSAVVPLVTITGETVGQWVFVQCNNIPLPAGSKSVEFSFRIQANTAVIPNDTTIKLWLTAVVANFASGTVFGYTRNTDEKISDLNTVLASDPTGVLTRLKNKKWTSYGDSITAANSYQTPVISRYKIAHNLRGIGGTTVTETSSIAWVDSNGLYLDRPPSVQPVGSFEILSSMSNQQRINTIPLDTQIITIMGGTNDFTQTLGTISDTGVATFYGAYQTMLNRIYARIPNAEVILSTIIHRTDEGDSVLVNSFRNAIKAIGEKYKYRVIDMAKSGINQINAATYLADGIHPTSSGYERMSRLLLSEFLNIYV